MQTVTEAYPLFRVDPKKYIGESMVNYWKRVLDAVVLLRFPKSYTPQFRPGELAEFMGWGQGNAAVGKAVQALKHAGWIRTFTGNNHSTYVHPEHYDHRVFDVTT